MNSVTRGIRNAFRNIIRTFSIVLILGLSIGLALAMVVARQTVQNKIVSVKSSIGNTVVITPAGAQGFQGGGEPLTTDQLKSISTMPNVTNVVETLNDRLTTDNTNLASAIDAGTLGNRAGRNSGVGFMTNPGFSQRVENGDNAPQITRTFTPPVIVTGTNNVSDNTVFGGNKPTFTSGQALDPTKDEDKAIVGKALADKNSLAVGSTFTAYGTPITVVGIYDTGNTFSNAGLIMSLPTLQRLSSQTGSVTNAEVTVNSVDNIDSVVSAIKNSLGSKADVVSNQDNAKQAIQPLESVKTISTFSLIGAIAAGAVIILLTMVMIVRERRREIGVFKAIGASNLKVMFQFMSEAVTLTILALVAGLIIGAVAANPVTKVLVNNSTNSSQNTAAGAGPDGAGAVTIQNRTGGAGGTAPQTFRFRAGGGLRNFGNNTLTNVRDIQASVGWSMLAYGVATAFVIALIGSAIPAFLISKVRPAEVMRAE